VSENLKCCSKKENCIHPDGPWLIRENFSKDKDKSDGLRRCCKLCDSAHRRQYRLDNLEKEREHDRQHRLDNLEAERARDRQYHWDHRDEHLARSRQYLIDHPDYNKQYYAEHKEEEIERCRQYKAAHLEEQIEYGRKYRAEHPEYSRKYNEEHPEVGREHNRRRLSRKKELPFYFNKNNEKSALEYWNNCCAICGKELDLTPKPRGHAVWAMDHWIAMDDRREDNPGTVPWNMLPMCHGEGSCNLSKNNNDPIEWLYRSRPDEAGSILGRINIYFELMLNGVLI
jgi:hypothetical protein